MQTNDLYSIKSECCGCWGCANICPREAISMQPDNEGFLYPIIDEAKCVNCGMCLKVCPVKTATKRINSVKEKPHIALVSLNLTHDFGAVITSAVLEKYINEISPEGYIVNTINYNYPSSVSNSKFKKVDLCRDDDIYRKQRFYIFRDNFMNQVDTIKSFDSLDKMINYQAFISRYDFDIIPTSLCKDALKGYDLDFETKARKIVYNNELCSPICFASINLLEEMISTAKIENDKIKYLYVYLINPDYDIIKLANEIAKDNSLCIYFCSNFECEFEAETIYCYTDGPAEFLYRLKNAELVLTDSNYCKIFAELFNKKVFTDIVNDIIVNTERSKNKIRQLLFD